MLGAAAKFLDRTVPRYTSYPTAPHFVPTINADTYASWLAHLPAAATLSVYVHVPFCERLCLYCGCHTKATRRQAPVEAYAARLSEEIDLVATHTGCRRVVQLHWGGGTPSILGVEQLYRFVAQLDLRFGLSTTVEHAIELDPRHVTERLAQVLADIGINRASLGVQDFSPHVQRAIGREQSFETVARAVDFLRGAGIADINFDLMYGLPGQTADDVRRTITLAHQLQPRRLAVFGYAHVPWFKPHQRLLDKSILPGPGLRVVQATAAHDTLVALGYQAIGLDHYADPDDTLAIAARTRSLRRNFQGYTVNLADVLIGLGASAIGRLPEGYVQNAADIGGYARAVGTTQLATKRGITFSADDRVRGRIIEELMCYLDCDVGDVAMQHDLEPDCFDHEIESLRPFEAEELVRIEQRRIAVEEKGRPYLRLIAAAFDAYLTHGAAGHSIAI
ncbi:MAG TPA: oxygen-independent coproporphyrinogen III oxidase [Xanthobacteraceae bacterium]|nr:oxygen-independent coproporphyrinogen III oxidase [Xanthobacteraceae bacterium]